MVDNAHSTRPKGLRRQHAPDHVSSEQSITSTGVDWPTKYNQVLAANNRLHEQLVALETAHRKSLTVVKYEPTLPNNDVYTKSLIEENRELLKRFRALELRLLKMDTFKSVSGHLSPRAIVQKMKKSRKKVGLPIRHISVQTDTVESEHDVSREDPKCFLKGENSVNKSTASENQGTSFTESRTQNSNNLDDEVRAIVTLLSEKLCTLELDLQRLQQENELLRADNETDTRKREKDKDEGRRSALEQKELEHLLNDRQRQMAVLEAKFIHLQEKSHSKSILHKEAIEKIEALNSDLFNARQRLEKQAESLQELDDKKLQLDIIGKEVRLLRSETLKLNETIAALSSRPFDTLDAQLEKKSIAIAVLEEENRKLESQLSQVNQDFRIVTQTNEKLRERLKVLNMNLETQTQEILEWKHLREQDEIARDIAQMQLEFYLSKNGDADDRILLSTIGKALKLLRTQEHSV